RNPAIIREIDRHFNRFLVYLYSIKVMLKPLHFIYLLLLLPLSTWGQYQRIDNFLVKENLTANGKIAIIAVDSLERSDESINGKFKFTINGFEQSLDFHNGVAVHADPIESTTVVYFKHKNHEKTTNKLYFLYKKDNEITPVKIYGLLLLRIPVVLLMIAYVFKRYIVVFIILAIVYGYFSFSKGLSITQILESAYHTIHSYF